MEGIISKFSFPEVIIRMYFPWINVACHDRVIIPIVNIQARKESLFVGREE